MVFISPDHEAGYFWGGGFITRGGRLTSPEFTVCQGRGELWTGGRWISFLGLVCHSPDYCKNWWCQWWCHQIRCRSCCSEYSSICRKLWFVSSACSGACSYWYQKRMQLCHMAFSWLGVEQNSGAAFYPIERIHDSLSFFQQKRHSSFRRWIGRDTRDLHCLHVVVFRCFCLVVPRKNRFFNETSTCFLIEKMMSVESVKRK